MSDQHLKTSQSLVPAVITGIVDRVIYSEERNGYAVVAIQQKAIKETVFAVGNLLGLQPGENVRLVGVWADHPKYGRRFQSESYTSITPRTVSGLEQYLGSGLVPGIGPGFARRIISHFGLETLRLLDQDSQRLREVPGIGAARAKQITMAWHEQREIRGVMMFLQSHGVSAAYAKRIYRQLGARARSVLEKNPYRLAVLVPGMGFQTADRIAAKLGIATNSPQRIKSAAMHELSAAATSGDMFLPKNKLHQLTSELTGLHDQNQIGQAIKELQDDGEVYCEEFPGHGALDRKTQVAYLPSLRNSEQHAAERLAVLLRTRPRYQAPPVTLDTMGGGISLSSSQQAATRTILRSKVVVLTGGPGTGKTTLVRWIANSFTSTGANVVLCAPTGRAAKRLEESSGLPAYTIHRLLEFNPRSGTFNFNRRHPVAADLIVVDEVSMVDIRILSSLLDATADGSRLLFVGDADQLPSVGPGSVLSDLSKINKIPTVRLNEVFRQSAKSQIVQAAHAINQGNFKPCQPKSDLSDFYFITRKDPEQIAQTLEKLVTLRIPQRFNLDPLRDIQVLSPMNRGPLGTVELNHRLRACLNPSKGVAGDGHNHLLVGDRVLQTRNNYQLEVFNGDIGHVVGINPDSSYLQVNFGDRKVSYNNTDRDDLVLAYAISIHRSQGSEFPAVVIPMHTQHFVMLRRNLLYTAVTRGKRVVVVVGSNLAISIATRRGSDRLRFSALDTRVAWTLKRKSDR